MRNGRFTSVRCCGLAALLPAILAGHAAAQTPPSYSESITIFPGGTTTSTMAGMISGSCFASGFPVCRYTADAEPTGGGFAHVTLSATSLAGIFSAQVNAGVAYGIVIAGTPGVPVPITVTSAIAATASSSGQPGNRIEINSMASLTISGPGVMYSKNCVAYRFIGVPGGCTEALNMVAGVPVAGFSTSGPITLLSGAEYSVSLTATANTQEFGTADAYADPIFTIDPAFAASFRLLGVPGAATAVPEPAVWSMLVLGFGTIGGAMRRRRGVSPRLRPVRPCDRLD